MDKNIRIYVAGHTGLAGSAVVRELQSQGYAEIITMPSRYLDLTSSILVDEFFDDTYIEVVINCAAHAGGIKEAIDNPVGMLLDNIRIQTNVIKACCNYDVKKLINLASSCIYPVDGEQPYTEEQIGAGRTDENWSYAVAKLAGIELCRAYHRQYGSNFMSVVPCNMYGPNDNFDIEKSHVIPSLIRKCHEKDFTIWGDGAAKREFIYTDDFAKAVVFLMENCVYEDLYDGVVNIGTNSEISIESLSDLVNTVINPEIWVDKRHDYSEPYGVPRKIMDSSRINKLGWKAETLLMDGIAKTYKWYLDSINYDWTLQTK